MNFIKNCLWVVVLLMLIDFLARHLYGYRVVDVARYLFNITELFAR
jgi:hypothetical protein